MIRRVLRSLLGRGAEMLLALALVLVFFLVFMWILGLSFPRGTSLVDLMRSERTGGEKGSAAGPGAASGQGGPGEQAENVVARLSHLRRDVKDKAADAIAWTPSSEGMSLGNHHAVQTFDRSGATITFSESSQLVLHENTLVILKRADPLTPRNRRLATLVVMDGELRGALAVSPDAPVNVEIEAATKTARLRSDAGPGTPAEFSVRVNEDASSTFTLFRGAAEISSERGNLVLEPLHSVTVDSTGSLGPSREVPPPPVILEPEDGVHLAFRASRSRMRFAWQGSTEGDAYLLTVARDPGLRDIVNSEPLATPEFTLGNLKAGTYYWSVSTRRGGLEGPPSPARQFRIARDLVEPRLEVHFPGRVVTVGEIEITGAAEPGTRVFVNNEEIQTAASGRFTHVLALQRGENMVVVEAIDAAGNVAYRSETINARY